VQVNEDELAQIHPDPMAVAARALAAGVGLLVVTLGPQGAAYFTQEGWRFARGARGTGPVITRRIAPPSPTATGDPTGCGDVFGATLLARLVHGVPLEPALAAAAAAAGRNVEHRGATSLHYHLRGAIAPA
jgi:sugar/nucleoside kinase (ribokinase family)